MNLELFFQKNTKVALAFSGGVDSAFLLYSAKKYGADVCAYYVNSQFQPEFELHDAKRLSKEVGANLKILSCDILKHDEVVANSSQRCYYCKQHIFAKIKEAANNDGYHVIIDGTNGSDDIKDRPGFKALNEMNVLSPLRECDMDKETIRDSSRKAGLFTWNKPSYACLATRISTGNKIINEDLIRIERAEGKLSRMGFKDFRVRLYGDAARIQVTKNQMELAINLHSQIEEEIKTDFGAVLLDLKER